MQPEPLLAVHGLCKSFPTKQRGQFVHAVRHVSFSIAPGEIVGMVGESGCGKSTIANLIVRLLDPSAGSMLFGGVDIARESLASFRHRRRDLQIVFQDPVSTLNPRHRIGRLIGEPLLLHTDLRGAELDRRVHELCDRVRLPLASLDRYPSQLSGGQLQRVGIARAIATRPKLVVLDEPTSALDLSVRASILELLLDLRDTHGLAMLLISHDLESVRRIADRVLVAYLGRIVEAGPTATILSEPAHPYTRRLLAAELRPVPGSRAAYVPKGEPPSPYIQLPGCGFAPLCPHTEARCRETLPPLAGVAPQHEAACIRAGDEDLLGVANRLPEA